MRGRRLTPWLAAVALAACAAGTVWAEVSGKARNGGPVDTLIMGDLGITDGVDPIPQVWKKIRPVPDAWVLNPSGEVRGDGRPDVYFHRPSGSPAVVWAYNHGTTHDIAIAFWEADGWGPIEFITSTSENEVDPRVFVRDDGTVHVVWWVDGPDPRVEVATRPAAGDAWTPGKRVSPFNEPGRRPTVAFHNGAVWVAYERNATENAFDTSEVAVRRESTADGFVLQHTAETTYDGPIEPVLHAREGTLWMDWRYSADQFAYAEILGSAGIAADLEAATDPSWVGVESVRLAISKLISKKAPAEPAGTP